MLKKHNFNKVQAYQMGYSLLGNPPLLTVYSYVVDGLLIDTGARHLYQKFLTRLASHSIEQIAVTHYHEDHSGNAEALRRHYNVPLHMGNQTADYLKQKLPMKLYRHWNFGQIIPVAQYKPYQDILETNQYTFEPIYTPGHSDDHYVLYERNEGWLFSGDLYLGNIKFTREEENLPDMLISMQNMMKLDFEALFCAHYPQPRAGKQHMANKIQYIEDFIGQVRTLDAKGLDTKDIRQVLGKREIYLLKWLTFNDAGVDFMIRAALKSATQLSELHQA
jgi:glyoxylase-like metal-dependent hydrolase (beta-lactamase superfamily II)